MNCRNVKEKRKKHIDNKGEDVKERKKERKYLYFEKEERKKPKRKEVKKSDSKMLNTVS